MGVENIFTIIASYRVFPKKPLCFKTKQTNKKTLCALPIHSSPPGCYVSVFFFNTPCLSVVHFLGLVLRFSEYQQQTHWVNYLIDASSKLLTCKYFSIKLAPEFQFHCLYQTKSLLAKSPRRLVRI